MLRTHGGASLSISDSFVEPFALRKKTNLEAKKYIGKIAASLIHNNDTLFITSSSTCLEFASHIKPDLRLNILTNGMPLAHKLSENNNVTVECPSGRLVSMLCQGLLKMSGHLPGQFRCRK